MDTKSFTANFIDLFDETPSMEVTIDTKFRDIDGWSSFVGLSIIAMVDEKYGVRITADELRSSNSIQDVFTLVSSKK